MKQYYRTLFLAACLQSILLPGFSFASSDEETASTALPSEPDMNYDPTGGAPFDLTDENRILVGKDRFEQNCASFCHGYKPILFVDRTGLNEVYVYEAIRDGGIGTQSPMPTWGTSLTPEEIWELVAYIKSLGDW